MTEPREAIVNELEQRITGLSPAKRAILERRLQKKRLGTNGEWSIPRRTNQEESLLSFSQQRMWFLDRLEPGNPAYNRPTNIRLLGQLNVPVLEQSLKEIIRRHEVLRTNFPSVQGQPTIAIAPHFTLSVPIVDLCHLSGNEQQEKVQQLAAQEAQKSFDLAQDCLVRAILIRLRDEEHILLLTFHHIVFDGWSMGVLIKELAVLYNAFVAGKPSPLTELPIQYADFGHWQRKQLQGEKFAAKLAYWQRQLGGKLPVLELPTDRRRSPVQTFRGARHTLKISSFLTTELKRLSQREGATLFMTLLAAFKVLLYRYTGREDIIIGSPIAGRDRLEIENLIGVFINTLALRTQLTGNLTFKELLAQVRQVALDAYTHQDVPFEKLVEELQPERNLSHTPIFQVLFQLRNIPQERVEFKGVKFEEFKCDRGIAAFDLTLDICKKNAGLLCLFEYNTDLFEAATIERMAGHFETLLQGIVANPEQPIYQLPLLTERERHQLLVEWNDTQTNYPQDKCIHQLFEEQVEKTPNAVAVVFEEQQLTYRELNERANQLAHYLQQLGIKQEVLVGLYLERSLNRIVGLLAILKVGGVYLPLDPTYPRERLMFILEDSQTSVIVTQDSLTTNLQIDKARIVSLERDWQKIQTQAEHNPQSLIRENNLAYVIYTSGSTGTPKGVLIEHQALTHHCQTIISHYQLNNGDRILQFASVGFDVSLEQILPTLIAGATLILSETKFLTGLDFHQKLQELGLTIVNLPPAYWTQWLQSLGDNSSATPIKQLRLVICGGEEMPPKSVKLWQKSPMKKVRLLNAYGPTETTITAMTFEVAQGSFLSKMPIGRPLQNRKVYILDAQLQPVPIGVAGELYIGGESLAQGYINRPDLTGEKFIPNPFDNSKFNRLYKTGDLARYLPDGNIEFLGRIDNQIKIRGFRIELGEIEAVLSQHPSVAQTVVIDREDTPGEKRLVAYLVPHHQVKPTAQDLRKFLQEKLPEYMIPSAFVLLETFPLTPNGKVDRRALPAPEKQLNRETEFIPPQTQIQEIVAAIWSQILNTPVSIHDNFFELGGHSLLATQVISRLQKALDLELPLRTLFEASTVAELGDRIETIRWARQPLPFHNTYTSDNYEEGEL